MTYDYDLLVVGSANADLVIGVERRPGAGETVLGSDLSVHPGGKGANQAVAAARLGARTALLARVGDDAHGRLLLDSQRAAGVDTAGVLSGGAPTGVALITVDPSGDNSIVVSPGANARLSPADVRDASGLLRAARVVSAQLEIPLETVGEVVAGMAPGSRFVLNPSPPVPLPAGILAACDPLIVNEHEARVVLGGPVADGPEDSVADEPESAGETPESARETPESARETPESVGDDPEEWARALLARGPRSVVITLGARGALVADDRTTALVPSVPVRAVDTTGAGDAFTAALAWRLGAGESLTVAAAYAARVGAAAVTKEGAQVSFPTAAEVASLAAAAPGSLPRAGAAEHHVTAPGQPVSGPDQGVAG
ncbi:ribokinase [Streptomyces sp. NPDC060131]|uniref:ribokinase n=1 Tax=unclassified Streptomyces TaxID=2593676 RepID=UPI00365D16E3